MKKISGFPRFLGINLTKDSGGWHLSFAPRFKIAAAVLAVGALVTLLSLMRYSESPGFCNSCHIMKPYYDAWKGSRHNKVACVKCHYPPSSVKTHLWHKFQALSQVAKYVTRTYSSKPYAEVADASCLSSGCHSTRLLEGWVKVGDKGVRFDHRPHLTEQRRGRQLRCTSCHSQIMVGRHMEVTYDTCYTCHFKNMGSGKEMKPLGGCLSCHNLPVKNFKLGNMSYNHKEFVTKQGLSCRNCHLGVVSGDGAAPRDRCLTCHNQPEKLDKYGDVPFLHENHVTRHHVACFHCHQEIKHSSPLKMAQEPAPAGAAAKGAPGSHPLGISFDCSYCHQDKHSTQLELYSGRLPEDIKGSLPELASPMFKAGVNCIGCHYQDKSEKNGFSGHTQKASEQACMKCHGGKFKATWGHVRDDVRSSLKQLAAKIAGAKAELARSTRPEGELEKARLALARAARLEQFLGTAHGEHNIYLTSLIMREADRTLGEAGRALGAELADISAEPLISGSYCATQCHQEVGVKVPPETVRVPASVGIAALAKKAMPHKAHTEMLGCVKCHDIGGHKNVPLRKNYGETCKECHK
ncbi:MAG: NapC/NirT family cytochrome c [Elusimicrobia bacterium]|nr:NapC/NirT family cytochrome c [Elusimicrobiota bacterium]